jgi:hypothetical protein
MRGEEYIVLCISAVLGIIKFLEVGRLWSFQEQYVWIEKYICRYNVHCLEVGALTRHVGVVGVAVTMVKRVLGVTCC